MRWQNSAQMTLNPRPQAEHRHAYKAFRAIGARWSDNDLYGHVNNVVYCSWFDTAAKGHFIPVYVDRATRRPAALPPELLSVLELLK
jgi:acyl-CoA thioesterase FadM